MFEWNKIFIFFSYFNVYLVDKINRSNKWVTSRENLFMPCANNKGADRYCLDRIIPLVSIPEISSLYLSSVAAQTGLSLLWSQTWRQVFLRCGSYKPEYSKTYKIITELLLDKTNKMTYAPIEAHIRLGIHPVWSESSLSAWRQLGP